MADIRVTSPENYKENTIIISTETNAPLMSLMYSKGFAANENYMTLAECEAVTNEQIVQLLDGNQDVEDFREFKYFTNITDVGEYFARLSKVKRIHLPKSLKHISGRMFLIPSTSLSAGVRGYLEEINGLEQIESVGRTAFQGQWKIKQMNFTQNLKKIGSAIYG